MGHADVLIRESVISLGSSFFALARIYKGRIIIIFDLSKFVLSMMALMKSMNSFFIFQITLIFIGFNYFVCYFAIFFLFFSPPQYFIIKLIWIVYLQVKYYFFLYIRKVFPFVILQVNCLTAESYLKAEPFRKFILIF